MASVEAKIVEDSLAENGVRITTMQLRIPTCLLAELNTHRALSKSASSARAIPLKSMIKKVEEDGFIPLAWGLSKPGMQAETFLKPGDPALKAAQALWKLAKREAIKSAQALVDDCDVHKQTANRILGPFAVTDSILTGTDWANLFCLRTHPDAEPHFRALAWLMADAYYRPAQPPKLVKLGEWHLPYLRPEERGNLPISEQKACSTARCARVSFANHDGSKPSVEKDLELYRRLLNVREDGARDPMSPPHMSPLEHVATPLPAPELRSANLRGWKSHRSEIPGESASSFDYEAAIARGWRDLAFNAVGWPTKAA